MAIRIQFIQIYANLSNWMNYSQQKKEIKLKNKNFSKKSRLKFIEPLSLTHEIIIYAVCASLKFWFPLSNLISTTKFTFLIELFNKRNEMSIFVDLIFIKWIQMYWKLEQTGSIESFLIVSTKCCGLGWFMSDLRSSRKPFILIEYNSMHSSYNPARKTSAVAYFKTRIFNWSWKRYLFRKLWVEAETYLQDCFWFR